MTGQIQNKLEGRLFFFFFFFFLNNNKTVFFFSTNGMMKHLQREMRTGGGTKWRVNESVEISVKLAWRWSTTRPLQSTLGKQLIETSERQEDRARATAQEVGAGMVEERDTQCQRKGGRKFSYSNPPTRRKERNSPAMPRVYSDGGGGKRGGGRHLIPPVESGRNGRETVPAPSGILDIFLFL
jgi:hypothetical protein